MSEEENPIYTKEELLEMFDTTFLPLLQQFAKRQKKAEKNGDEFVAYKVELSFLFPEQEPVIKFEELSGISFQMTPQVLSPKDKDDEINP